MAPTIVAPERDVPGTNANNWKTPTMKANLYVICVKSLMTGRRPLLRFSTTINKTP